MKMGQKSKLKEIRTEQTLQDHELFLQAFEKPTQIYRYLRTRNLISPIFLNRNLTFMKKRMSRNNEGRKTFKIDCLLDRRLKEDNDLSVANLGAHMTLTFLGYYDKSVDASLDKVRLELLLVKLSHKKRKESASPIVQVSLETNEVPVNPSEENPPPKAPALSISSESFSLSNVGSTSIGRVKTYSLLIRVHPGGEDDTGQDENLEPASKRRKGRWDGGAESIETGGRIVSAELVIFDKHSKCLLTEGEYELVMSDTDGKSKISPKKNDCWELIDVDPQATPSSHQFQVFSRSPTLKFRLSWGGEKAGPMVERPRPLMPRDNGQDAGYLRNKLKEKKQKSSPKAGEKPTQNCVSIFVQQQQQTTNGG